MLKKSLPYIIIILSVFALYSCNYLDEPSPKSENASHVLDESDLILSCERVVKDLIRNCNIVVDKETPIIVTSLVDVDDLSKSSSMGRMASEIIANKLSQQGFAVKELKMGKNKIFVKEGMGEFILSRKIKEIAESYDVQAVLAGTYAIGEEVEKKMYGDQLFTQPLTKVYMSVRIIETKTNNIGCSSSQSMVIENPRLWR